MEAMQSETIGKLAAALAQAQAELPAALKNAENPHLRNRYADLAAVYEATRQVLPRHELAVIQTAIPTDGTRAAIRTTLAHSSGEWIAGELCMPLDRQGGPQGMGSALTYARRYSLAALVGVVSEDDDDGNAAQGRKSKQEIQQVRAEAKANNSNPATDPQRRKMYAIMGKRYGDNREAIIKVMSDFFKREIKSSNELTTAEVAKLIDWLESDSTMQEAY